MPGSPGILVFGQVQEGIMEKRFRLIVHVPVSHADVVRQAIGDAGGGVLGHYSHCSFSVRGVGRFRPLEGAQPHIGAVGVAEEVEEERIEVGGITEDMIVEVVAAVRRVHPYEEPTVELVEVRQV
jgi:hypothetical protein